MFGKYNGFVSKARVSACMYFLVWTYLERQKYTQRRHVNKRAKDQYKSDIFFKIIVQT